MPGPPSPSCRSMSAWRKSTARCWRPRPIWATAPLRRFLRITLPLSHARRDRRRDPDLRAHHRRLRHARRWSAAPEGAMIANLIEVQFDGVGNWPLGAALSLASMAMVAVIARRCSWRRRARGGEEPRDEKQPCRALCPRLSGLPLCAGAGAAGVLLQQFASSSPFRSPASPPAGIAGLAADSAMLHALGNSLKVGRSRRCSPPCWG